MRFLGLGVVVLGLVALGFIAVDAMQTPDAAAADRPIAVQQLIGWAACVGLVALVTLAGGLRDARRTRRDRHPTASPPAHTARRSSHRHARPG